MQEAICGVNLGSARSVAGFRGARIARWVGDAASRVTRGLAVRKPDFRTYLTQLTLVPNPETRSRRSD